MNCILKKRDCGINMNMQIDSGWMDFSMEICGEHLSFMINNEVKDPFSSLLNALYYLYPDNDDIAVHEESEVYHYKGIYEETKDGYQVGRIVEKLDDFSTGLVRLIPQKAEFTWMYEYEDEKQFKWKITRQPTLDTDFDIDIMITESDYDRECIHSFRVQYQDMCYATAKLCTELMKRHGFLGYHNSCFFEDIPVRYLLLIKSIALDNFEARELTDSGEGLGESTVLEKEIELLLFDM